MLCYDLPSSVVCNSGVIFLRIHFVFSACAVVVFVLLVYLTDMWPRYVGVSQPFWILLDFFSGTERHQQQPHQQHQVVQDVAFLVRPP